MMRAGLCFEIANLEQQSNPIPFFILGNGTAMIGAKVIISLNEGATDNGLSMGSPL